MFEKDPRVFEADLKGLSPEQKAMVKLEITMKQFFTSLNTSISRWERLIYPLMIVMGFLAVSGFYLIYSVTRDMHTLTENIDPQMEFNLDAMNSHMGELSKNIAIMTSQVTLLVEKIDNMDQNIVNIDGNISLMTGSIGEVTTSMDSMTNDLTAMNSAIVGMSSNVAYMDQSMRADRKSVV